MVHPSIAAGWQKFLENNGPSKSATATSLLSAPTVGTSTGACLPLLHLHGSAQEDSSAETHIAIVVTSSVIIAGAQKSESGIKALPSDQTQVPSQVVAVLWTQLVKSCSALAASITFGWQNSLVKSGVSPAGTDGFGGKTGALGSTTGFAGSTGATGVVVGIHSHGFALAESTMIMQIALEIPGAQTSGAPASVAVMA